VVLDSSLERIVELGLLVERLMVERVLELGLLVERIVVERVLELGLLVERIVVERVLGEHVKRRVGTPVSSS